MAGPAFSFLAQNTREACRIPAAAIAGGSALPASDVVLYEMSGGMDSLVTRVSELSKELAELRAKKAALPKLICGIFQDELQCHLAGVTTGTAITPPPEPPHHTTTPRTTHTLQPYCNDSPPPTFQSSGGNPRHYPCYSLTVFILQRVGH